MGVDITMCIVSKGKELAHNIYDGRNREWFDNLMGRFVTEPAYQYLYADYGWDCDGECPQDLTNKYTKPDPFSEICYYFGHYSIKVGDFRKWFETYRPNYKAGYVSRYDKWLFDNKNIIPDLDNLKHFLDEDDNIEDNIWIEFIYPTEPSCYVMEYLKKHNISDDAWIVYCFDN